MVYDVHAHCIPEELLSWLSRHGEEIGIETLDGGRLRLAGKRTTGPLRADLTDRALRLEKMDAAGVNVQVLSSWVDLTAYELEATKGVQWSRVVNETLASEAAAHPGRFLALATVPLQSPEAAAEELRRAVTEMGMVGVELATNIDGAPLDQAGLDDVWAAAEETGAFLLLHPMAPLRGIDLGRYFLSNVVGRAAETTIALAGLLFSGVFERFPALRMCVVHGGGFAPFQVGRLDRGHAAGLTGKAISRAPSDYLHRLYVDTVVHSPLVLRFLVDMMGADHVLLGTDYPFPMGDADPVALVGSVPGLTAEERELILSGTAATLLDREP